jgi:hypothetical protein
MCESQACVQFIMDDAVAAQNENGVFIYCTLIKKWHCSMLQVCEFFHVLLTINIVLIVAVGGIPCDLLIEHG